MAGRTTFNDSQIATHSLLSPDFVLSQKYGIGPDFQVHTGTIKAFSLPDQPDRPLVRMCGSSTIFDLQNDCMMLSALQDMQKAEPGMTIFLNHSYQIPQDCFGKLHDSPTIQMSQSIADLWLTAEALLDNPDAARTYSMIVKDGVKFGCSIGCMVLDWSFADPDDEWNSPILIHRVQTLEWSVVGIPAVQRCWVENSIKGLFARALVEGKGEEALRLAPAYKGLFQREYPNVVREVTSKGLQRDLSKVAMRNARPQRIVYDFQQEGFQLTDGRQMKKSLSRAETADIFKFQDAAGSVAQVVAKRDLAEPEGEHGWDVWQKACIGKTSWDLAPLNTEWTGSRAEKDIFAFARAEDGEIQPAKAKQGFLLLKPGKDPSTQGAYGMPYCYSDGDDGLKIVPEGVRSCANVLAGGMGGVGASDEDITAMKAKTKTMIHRINRELKPDPAWGIPWEKDDDDKKEDSAMTGKTKGKKEIADSGNADALNRQDLGETAGSEQQQSSNEPATMKAASDVSVAEDGTHEACTGAHSHAHTTKGVQGDDKTHKHQHTHQGDASHDHDHDDDADGEKSGDEAVEKQASALPSPSSSSEEVAAAEPTGESTPAAEPTSEVENVIAPGAETSNDIEAILRSLDAEAPFYEARLGIWNDLAKSMELPTYSWNAVKHFLARSRAGQEADPKTLWDQSNLAQKDGRTISAKTATVLQGIHDACLSLHPGVCSNTPNNDGDPGKDDNDETKLLQGTAMHSKLLELHVDPAEVKHAVREVMVEEIKGLTTTVQQAFMGMMEHFGAQMGELRHQQKAVETSLLKAKAEQATISDQVARLKEMPLGRPTHLHRSVSEQGAVAPATYQEMRTAGHTPGAPVAASSLAELEAHTSVEERQVPQRSGQPMLLSYRRWPAGVGSAVDGSQGGVARPPLTQAQSVRMLYGEREAYNAGLEASVPLLDDPFGL